MFVRKRCTAGMRVAPPTSSTLLTAARALGRISSFSCRARTHQQKTVGPLAHLSGRIPTAQLQLVDSYPTTSKWSAGARYGGKAPSQISQTGCAAGLVYMPVRSAALMLPTAGASLPVRTPLPSPAPASTLAPPAWPAPPALPGTSSAAHSGPHLHMARIRKRTHSRRQSSACAASKGGSAFAVNAPSWRVLLQLQSGASQ